VSFPEPYAGLVIRYAYLWKREFDAGREEGTKDRPCAIVMTVVDEDGDKEVLVLPVTHSQPTDPADAIEIPAATKSRLGLDGERSWIMITEANEFLWSGPDLRTVPGRDESTIDETHQIMLQRSGGKARFTARRRSRAPAATD
jgi:hypothetical protein